MIDEGKMPPLAESTSIGEVIMGSKPGRTDEKERITFVACGMATFDVGLGYDLYHTALKEGIGTKLTLWDDPYQK